MRRILLFPWLVRLLANKKILDIKFFFFIRTTHAITYKLSERHKWHIPLGNIFNAYVCKYFIPWQRAYLGMASETIVQLECFICQSRWPLLFISRRLRRAKCFVCDYWRRNFIASPVGESQLSAYRTLARKQLFGFDDLLLSLGFRLAPSV